MYDIVIVEDELIAAEYLKALLTSEGFNIVKIIQTGKEAIEEIPKIKSDLVLMDIMLKDNISGSEAAVQLKYSAPDVAIVFLTAYAEDEMIEYAIESNTYGYLMKPYDEVRILASLKIILAKMKSNTPVKTTSKSININKTYSFNFSLKRLFKKDKEVTLGQKSLDLLEILCKNPNATISTEQLCLKIWGENKDSSMLRTQVSRTKKEMGIDIISNTKGLGYKIVCKL